MALKPIRQILSVEVLLLALLVIACGGSPVASPTPATALTPSPSGSTATATEESNQISIPEIGLNFGVPAGWQRQGENWTWVPIPSSGADAQRLGVNWKDIRPGEEPEALLLPNNSVMLDRTPGPELAWGTAATYRLQVMVPGGQGQVEAVEIHVIVTGTDKYYDFSASAPTEEQLDALEPVLQHMLASAEVTPTKPPTLTSAPSPTPTAELPGVPLQPLATAAAIRFDSWSPNSDWVAYWSSAEEDVETAPYPIPWGTLHFLNIRTGQDCSYPEYVAHGYDHDVIWQSDGQVMVVSGGSTRRGTPCGDDFTPVANPGDADIGKPDTALSPEAGYRARTRSQDEADGTISAVTTIADASTGEVINVVEWKHEGGLGEFGLGGQWLTEDLFLINETLDQGPLLIALGNGTIEVASELFGLPPLERREPDNSAHLRAEGGVVKGTRTYHVVLHGAGTDITLYHSETAEVERIPLRHPSYLAFSPDGRWLMLYERYDKDGYERQALSIRPVDPPGSEARLFAEEFSYAVWSPEGMKIAVGLPGGAISVFSLPDGVQLGSWTTGRYEALPIAWSPDGNLLAVEGYASGEWQQALFVVQQ